MPSNRHRQDHLLPMPDLKSANGSSLHVLDVKTVPISIKSGQSTLHRVYFVQNLQVPAIIGMDYMSTNHLIIDTQKLKIHFPDHGTPPDNISDYSVNVVSQKDVTIAPMEEAKVVFEIPSTLPVHDKYYFSSKDCMSEESLLCLDGVVGRTNNLGSTLVINKGNRHIKLTRNSPLGELHFYPDSSFRDYHEVFSISSKTTRPELRDVSHVQKIDLTHILELFRLKYQNLLNQYADVFSKHDLDVGHSKTLPHEVRLTDPNRVVSINQYRLPYHLKEVAIDYVDRLLRSGVIRPSTSVFNSPLMLVKKPNVSKDKPLREQYRLVHNYVELNKSIIPCSYPLRHLYELLDEVASGKIFSVLDLSQGFFQQTLKDPLEATSFSIPGYGQFTYTG